MLGRAWWSGLGWAAVLLAGSVCGAQPLPTGILEFDFTPVRYAQLALWVENDQGEFLATVRLTEGVAYRGIGNRPGASEMNSGFRWPYGRREGVLPVWATRRAAAPGAQQFQRVIFQNRTSEGRASRTSDDFSADVYYCISFDPRHAAKDALDAVSCASPTQFSSDKGRFITAADVAAGYAEPYEEVATRNPVMRPLSLDSLYPPRRDVTRCNSAGNCVQHPDVARFSQHVHDVMPDIDAITMATPAGGVMQQILYMVPSTWQPGGYRACLEINVEGDYNSTFNERVYPTPTKPGDKWDSWAVMYGYPYRGQPSVVYCSDFRLGDETEQTFSTDRGVGSAGSWDLEDPQFGQLAPMDGMTDDPVNAPGSGADRIQRMADGTRFKLVVKPALSCSEDPAPSAVGDLIVENVADVLHADEWVHVRFRAANDDQGIFRYDVRVAATPIVDDVSFMAAMPAKQATIEAAELSVPTKAAAGTVVQFDMGGLVQQTHYFVAVRAMDACAGVGPIVDAEITTKARVFATVTPCFVATAAWGSPLAQEVGVLRRMRDRHLQTNAVGRALVSAYYAAGSTLADAIRGHAGLRRLTRVALAPVIALAKQLDE